MSSNAKRKFKYFYQNAKQIQTNTKLKTFVLLLFLCGHVFYFRIVQEKRKSEEEIGGGGEKEKESQEEEEVKITRREWKEMQEEMLRLQNYSIQDQSFDEGWKRILVWSSFSSPETDYESFFIRLTSGECEESRCKINFGKIFATDVDAILFRARDVIQSQNKEIHLPTLRTRNPKQIYVFYSMETPIEIPFKLLESFPKNFFNWTMGYRVDSDVLEPFGRVTKRDKKEEIKIVSQKELEEKKMAAWISSPCYIQVARKREDFLNSLSSHIRIDNLGMCYEKSCRRSRMKKIYGRELDENACDSEIQNYVFYLALEKSFCIDYISERIFKAWKYGAIPIVFGEANYSRIAPPNSYIDLRDFDSVKGLAEYMKKVASNSSLYNQYFKWREAYEVDVGIPDKPLVCDLCKKLHEQDKTRMQKSYEDIYKWFVTKDDCTQQQTFN